MRRRKAIVAGAVLVVSAACGSSTDSDDNSRKSTPAGSTTAPLAARSPVITRRATAAEPLRVLLVGDSVAITFEPSLTAALRELEPTVGPAIVLKGAAMGFGLTSDRESLYDGRTLAPMFPDYMQGWKSYIDFTRPEVVVVMLGTWDVVPRLVDGEWLEPDARGWDAWYRDLLTRATTALSATGAHVTWITQPCVDVANEPDPVNDVLRSMRDELERLDSTVVDLDSRLCLDGHYSATLRAPGGAVVMIRRDDGVHFADGAHEAVGPLLASLLAEAWLLA